tara:strand:+ start:12708 stop:13952 length:1245 start_codon:yes stop_codon:yes gene_type:complete
MDKKKIKYWDHSSGIQFVLVQDYNAPLISIDIWCKAGISFEKKDQEGIAHFLEHMIFKGSNKLKPGEFDYKIESLCGTSNASTGYDDSHYYVLIPPDNLKESITLLTNLVFNPKFNISEFNLEKSVVIEEIKQQNDQPEEVLFNYFLERVWQGHFYGKTILGREDHINKISINDLHKFHQERYKTENICIALAGNLPHDIFNILENVEIDSKFSKDNKLQNLNQFNFSIRSSREKVFFKNLQLSRLLIAWKIPSLKDQKSIVGFEILSSLLVDGRNSKLGKALKEEQNLVESLYVDLHTGEFGSLMILEACFPDINLNLVESKINKILNDLLDFENYTIEELIKAQRIVRSNYFFNLETVSQKTSFFGNHLLWGRKNPIDKLEENLIYWTNKKNFRKIIRLFSNQKYTLLAQRN